MTARDISGLRRDASLAQVGGMRPPTDPHTSWMGNVPLAAADEGWPHDDAGKPMHGVLQLMGAD